MLRFHQEEISQSSIYFLFYDAIDFNEYLHCLTSKEQERIANFQHEKRRQEFVATRIIRHINFPKESIHYDEFGAPYFLNGNYISISHCKGVSAIAVNEKHRIGLDLEWIAPKAKKLQSKFLNKEEQQILDIEDELLMTRAWSVKESLYKLAQLKGAIFKENLIIRSHTKEKDDSFDCEILKKEMKNSVHLTSRRLENLIITINSHKAVSF